VESRFCIISVELSLNKPDKQMSTDYFKLSFDCTEIDCDPVSMLLRDGVV